jgi:hypothetical protein
MPTMPNIPRAAAAGAALVLLAACRPERTAGPGDVVPRRDLTGAEAQAVRASNAFAFGLLREVGAEPRTAARTSCSRRTAARRRWA